MRTQHSSPKAWVAGLALGGLLAGCGSGGSGGVGNLANAENGRVANVAAPLAAISYSTLIPDSLEIDQLRGGPGDANLVVGDDPADNSASARLPVGGPLTFIDWNDLGPTMADHRMTDFDNAKGVDPTAFPRSNECVSHAQVLSKMNLTYVATANNTKYAYIAVQRANNNGDSAYYWLFTKEPPVLRAGEAPCKADENRLLYNITGQADHAKPHDVLVAGHFHPSGPGPLVTVYRAKRAAVLTAVEAIDYTDATLWEVMDLVVTDAVNMTPTAPGAFGSQGVVALDGRGNLLPEVFAEAAIPLSVFTQGANCGVSYFGSVISRSSGAGGTSPDLKDLAGPGLFNFGSLSATAEMKSTCVEALHYALASVTGFDGKPIPPDDPSLTCAWTFDNGATSSTCSGEVALAAGAHTATVTVTEQSGCSATITPTGGTAYAPLGVSAALVPHCSDPPLIDYAATITGGSGAATVAWAFCGGLTSSAVAGSIFAPAAVACAADVVATDVHPDGVTCQASGSASATAGAPILLALAGAAPECSDVVTFTAAATGGAAAPLTLTWSEPGCSGNTCVVDPSDAALCPSGTVSVTASDGSALCPDPTASKVWTKVTSVVVSP